MRMKLALVAATVALWPHVGAANAATDAVKCAVAKIKNSAKYASCLLQTDAKAQTDGVTSDHTKCDTKQSGSFAKIDGKYGASCPTQGDQASVQGDVSGPLGCVAGELTGGGVADCDVVKAQLCGNGVVDPGEVCDQSDFGGATCTSVTAGVKNSGNLRCVNCQALDTTDCGPCSAVIDGTCWVLGAPGDSCTATCALKGKTYSTATETVTLAGCGRILFASGAVDTDVIQNNGPLGTSAGCINLASVYYLRVGEPITGAGSYAGARRACACQ